MLCSVGWVASVRGVAESAKRRRDDPQPCWRLGLPWFRPVSRHRFARLAGDL